MGILDWHRNSTIFKVLMIVSFALGLAVLVFTLLKFIKIYFIIASAVLFGLGIVFLIKYRNIEHIIYRCASVEHDQYDTGYYQCR